LLRCTFRSKAAIWAETISDFDDLCFLLLPRLAGVAHKGWSDPQVVTAIIPT
jgi:hypothetical protein